MAEGDVDDDIIVEDYFVDSDNDDIDYFSSNHHYCELHINLKQDVRMAAKAFSRAEEEVGIPAVQIEETESTMNYMTAVVLSFPVTSISEHILTLWDLNDTPTILLFIDNIHRSEFRTCNDSPTVCPKKATGDKSSFIVGEQLANYAMKIIRNEYRLMVNESPSVVGSFFTKLYTEIQNKLDRLTEYCVVCGEKLWACGILPSICDRDLCVYQYQELHLFDNLMYPRVSGEVLSLLLYAFANANGSSRRSDILTPPPPIRDSKQLMDEALAKANKIFDDFATNNREVEAINYLIRSLPCPNSFVRSVTTYQQFRKEWPVMSKIIDWLVISNRSYIERVPRSMNVDFLKTDLQYLFVADSPAKQAEFDELARANGGRTRFFFHGSPPDNWHSIIRNGLKVMSGSKFQLVGAAYGNGIYLSPSLNVSLSYSYSRNHVHTNFSRFKCQEDKCCETEKEKLLHCVALVEVIDCPEGLNSTTDPRIYLAKDEKYCSLRMLLLYHREDIDNMRRTQSKSMTGSISLSSNVNSIPTTTGPLSIPPLPISSNTSYLSSPIGSVPITRHSSTAPIPIPTSLPTSQSTVPTTQSTVPTTLSTVPTTQSTVPTTQSTVPTTQSTVPTTQSSVSLHTSSSHTQYPQSGSVYKPKGSITFPNPHTSLPTTHSTVPTTHSTVPTIQSSILPLTSSSTNQYPQPSNQQEALQQWNSLSITQKHVLQHLNNHPLYPYLSMLPPPPPLPSTSSSNQLSSQIPQHNTSTRISPSPNSSFLNGIFMGGPSTSGQQQLTSSVHVSKDSSTSTDMQRSSSRINSPTHPSSNNSNGIVPNPSSSSSNPNLQDTSSTSNTTNPQLTSSSSSSDDEKRKRKPTPSVSSSIVKKQYTPPPPPSGLVQSFNPSLPIVYMNPLAPPITSVQLNPFVVVQPPPPAPTVLYGSTISIPAPPPSRQPIPVTGQQSNQSRIFSFGRTSSRSLGNGELSYLTDEQRNQIYRVVQLFKNADIIDRVKMRESENNKNDDDM